MLNIRELAELVYSGKLETYLINNKSHPFESDILWFLYS